MSQSSNNSNISTSNSSNHSRGSTDHNNANVSRLSAEAFAELLSGPLLEIEVGADHKRWFIHQNLLRHYSPFFNDDPGELVNGEEKRIRNGKLSLPDEDVAAFRIFVRWLYQGHIENVSTFTEKQAKWDYAYACHNVYILCERIGPGFVELKNSAIDQFRRGCFESRLVPGAEEILPVYRRTKPGSMLRNLTARIAARQIMDPDHTRDAVMYRSVFEQAPEFAIDVVNAIREGTGGSLMDDPTEGNGCRFHIHDNGHGCVKTVHFEDES